MPNIFQLLHDDAQDIHRSDDLTRAMVGLIGDLADTFGPQLKQLLQADWVMQLIREAKSDRHYGITTRETARWAKEVCMYDATPFNAIQLFVFLDGQTSNPVNHLFIYSLLFTACNILESPLPILPFSPAHIPSTITPFPYTTQ